tara:strand:+ start:565 stop:1164 length:600 start_codon:yes stop_codon:yes gene_type:complete
MVINNNVKFMHIPHTGGRYLSYVFKYNGHFCYGDNFQIKHNNIDLPHLTALESRSFYKGSIFKKFTIVRNPLSRFIACLMNDSANNNEGIEHMFKNERNFISTVDSFRHQKANNNWFEPQINFIDKDTKIWRFENGFGIEFFKFIGDNFNIELDPNKEYNSYKFTNKNVYRNTVKLNEEQKQWVKNYYFLDYKILNYES